VSLVKFAGWVVIWVLLSSKVVWANGQFWLLVGEDLPVWARPKATSTQVGVLRPQERYEHTGRRDSKYIEIRQDGALVYVRRADMKKSRLVTEKSLAAQFKGNLLDQYRFGVHLGYSFYQQGQREIQTTPDTFYDVSSFSGSAPVFDFYFERQFHPAWAVQGLVGYRNLLMGGEARLRDSMGQSTSTFELSQNFLMVGFGLKCTVGERLWLLGYFELL